MKIKTNSQNNDVSQKPIQQIHQEFEEKLAKMRKLNSIYNLNEAATFDSPSEEYDYVYGVKLPSDPKKNNKAPKPRWFRYIMFQLTIFAQGLYLTFFGRAFMISFIGGIYTFYSEPYSKDIGFVFILGSFVFLIGLIIWVILKNKEYTFN